MKRSKTSIEYKGIVIDCEFGIYEENYGADRDGNRGQREVFLDHLKITTSEPVDAALSREIHDFAKRTIKEEMSWK